MLSMVALRFESQDRSVMSSLGNTAALVNLGLTSSHLGSEPSPFSLGLMALVPRVLFVLFCFVLSNAQLAITVIKKKHFLGLYLMF